MEMVHKGDRVARKDSKRRLDWLTLLLGSGCGDTTEVPLLNKLFLFLLWLKHDPDCQACIKEIAHMSTFTPFELIPKKSEMEAIILNSVTIPNAEFEQSLLAG